MDDIYCKHTVKDTSDSSFILVLELITQLVWTAPIISIFCYADKWPDLNTVHENEWLGISNWGITWAYT